jgi:hypothetical protein
VWRDFVDIYTLAHMHSLDGAVLLQSIQKVAGHREVALTSLVPLLDGYAAIAQSRWTAWLRKQHLTEAVPTEFQIVLDYITKFAEPMVTGRLTEKRWDSTIARWMD